MLIICCICYGLTIFTSLIGNFSKHQSACAMLNTIFIAMWLWIITCQVFNI